MACVRDVVDELQPPARGRTIRWDAPAALSGRWDPDRIRQVLINLVSNALKYSPGDVEIHVAREDEDAIVAVHDHGHGIGARERARLFRPYERLGVRERPGLGLGLFISREIVQAHAGTISVDSKPDGATFTVRLPLAGPMPVAG